MGILPQEMHQYIYRGGCVFVADSSDSKPHAALGVSRMCFQFTTALLILLVGLSSSALGETQNSLQMRSLNFPDVGTVDTCPVSIGRRDKVLHDADNIFCDVCAWHGSGPVYLAFAWAPAEQSEARFVLSDVRNVTAGVYTVKTPLVAVPDYEGPILIRGQRLGVSNEEYTLFPGTRADSMAKL